MFQSATIVFCDRCEAAAARCQRGWRAYITSGINGESCVTVVCPSCAELTFGEDEAAWSG
jgi:hypothetical protein